MTKTRSQLIFDDVQLNEEELADILAHSIPQSPAIWTNPAFGPGTTQNLFESPGFSARKMAHDMAEIGIVAGNLKTSLTKSYKEWELLTTLQRVVFFFKFKYVQMKSHASNSYFNWTRSSTNASLPANANALQTKSSSCLTLACASQPFQLIRFIRPTPSAYLFFFTAEILVSL